MVCPWHVFGRKPESCKRSRWFANPVAIMIDQGKRLRRAAELNNKLYRMFEARANAAREHFIGRARTAYNEHLAHLPGTLPLTWNWWSNFYDYGVDCAQRSVLFWDTLRQRGNCYLEHERAGKPPVLHFDYQTVLDARKFENPVNYALLCILPPKGVTVDPRRRPYIIIDPRAGHGPGIGGFKDDSQI